MTDLRLHFIHSCNRIVYLLKIYINQGIALVVKLVDTKDLKGEGLTLC